MKKPEVFKIENHRPEVFLNFRKQLYFCRGIFFHFSLGFEQDYFSNFCLGFEQAKFDWFWPGLKQDKLTSFSLL